MCPVNIFSNASIQISPRPLTHLVFRSVFEKAPRTKEEKAAEMRIFRAR